MVGDPATHCWEQNLLSGFGIVSLSGLESIIDIGIKAKELSRLAKIYN